jgi:hypothetical protein
MKNKKIFLLTILFLGMIFSQKLSAMNFLRVPILAPVSFYAIKKLMVCYCAVIYNKQFESAVSEADLIKDQPLIPAHLSKYLSVVCKAKGVDIFFFPKRLKFESTFFQNQPKKYKIPQMAVVSASGSKAIFFLNSTAIHQLEEGKCNDLMWMVLHELGHVVNRDSEKQCILEVGNSIFSSLFVIYIANLIGYQGDWYMIAACSVFAGNSINQFILPFYSRHRERQADQYVMQHSCDRGLELAESYFRKVELCTKKATLLSSLFSSHPTHKERADAFAAELARRKVAKK